MEELINDYERKIKAVNELLEQQNDIVAIKRLETKRGCYRAFIVDLKRAMADADTGDRQLTIPDVTNRTLKDALIMALYHDGWADEQGNQKPIHNKLGAPKWVKNAFELLAYYGW